MNDLDDRTGDALLNQLRGADPCRHLATAIPPDAAAMRERIIATPPPRRSRRSRPSRPSRPSMGRRFALAGALAAAAVATAVVVPSVLGHDQSAAAYTVTRHTDGSVRVTLRWSELTDTTQLQARLRAAGVPIVIFDTEEAAVPPGTVSPGCARPDAGGPYNARAVEWDSPAANDVNGIIIRPKYFPAHGTFVIQLVRRPGSGFIDETLSRMIVGAAPTCPMIIGGPTKNTFGTHPGSGSGGGSR